MIYGQHFCAKCGNAAIRRNSSSGGQANYECQVWGHQSYFQPAAIGKAWQSAQVAPLLKHNSLRNIVRLSSIAPTKIAKRVIKAQLPIPRGSACDRKRRKKLLGDT